MTDEAGAELLALIAKHEAARKAWHGSVILKDEEAGA